MNRLRLAVGILTVLFTSCSSPSHDGGGGGGGGHVEQAFDQSSAESGIPARLMMATGFIESGLSADASSAQYLTASKGLRMTQSAFGMTLAQLKLDATTDGSDLAHQIDAYAMFLKDRLAKEDLDSAMQTSDAKARWALALGSIHRTASAGAKNLQALFAREVIDTLNNGFVWQDPQTGEILNFPKENPPIDLGSLPLGTQRDLHVDYFTSDMVIAKAIQIGRTGMPTGNKPTHVVVTHCPLSLSGCLALQDNGGDEIRLGAHYVVPQAPRNPDQPDAIFDRPIQVANSDEVVNLTDASGKTQEVKDAIVVMLAGFSGHYVNGVRQRAEPTWISETQLSNMGSLIHEICIKTIAGNDEAATDKCMSSDGSAGVKFLTQQSATAFQWGDVADYEPLIFNSYIQNSDRRSATMLTFQNTTAQFQAGQAINYSVTFDPSTTHLKQERLVRCSDNRLVWAVEDREQFSQGVSQLDLVNRGIFDAGPNSNGEQFFRVVAYADDNSLAGWTISPFNITGFDTSGKYSAPSDACP